MLFQTLLYIQAESAWEITVKKTLLIIAEMFNIGLERQAGTAKEAAVSALIASLASEWIKMQLELAPA